MSRTPYTFVYLASQSPRRQQLLQQIGAAFELLLPDAHEDAEALEAHQRGETPQAYVQRVTRLKLAAARQRLQRRIIQIEEQISLKISLRPAHNVSRAHSPRLTYQLTAAAKQNERRNAANIISPRHSRRRLRIHFRQAHPRLQRHGRLLERRRHHLAGPTPFRPEIHQQRNVVAGDVPIKRFVTQRQRFTCEHRLMTTAAARARRQLLGR